MINSFYTSQFLSDKKTDFIKNNPILESSNDIILNLSESDLQLNSCILALNETIQDIMNDVSLQEGIGTAIRHAKDAVAKGVVKFTLAEKSLSERINEKFNRYLQIARDTVRNSSYESIVKNAINLSRTLKNLLGSAVIGVIAAIPGGPIVGTILAIVAFIAKVAYDKRTDSKYKEMILNDLKLELSIVQEKIRDASSRGDTNAKYKLMRIENQLGRTIDRLRFNLREYQQ